MKTMSESSGMMNRVGFKLMTWTYRVVDFFVPEVDKKLEDFGLSKGDVVIDYGCGPGRYIRKASEMVGQEGLVYAADIEQLALKEVGKIIDRQGLDNVEPVLIHGYDSGLETGCANLIYALDMFHNVNRPDAFLAEIKRLLKDEGTFILEDGHQSRKNTVQKVQASGIWQIEAATDSYLRCLPRP